MAFQQDHLLKVGKEGFSLIEKYNGSALGHYPPLQQCENRHTYTPTQSETKFYTPPTGKLPTAPPSREREQRYPLPMVGAEDFAVLQMSYPREHLRRPHAECTYGTTIIFKGKNRVDSTKEVHVIPSSSEMAKNLGGVELVSSRKKELLRRSYY